MNITLTPQLEAIVQQKVDSGDYQNASEVLREALTLLEERDHRDRLIAAIAIGNADVERGDLSRWTPQSMSQLIREADEEDRLNLPIADEVQP